MPLVEIKDPSGHWRKLLTQYGIKFREIEEKPVDVSMDNSPVPEFDELFAWNAFVHVERMNETGFWIGIDCANGEHWMINTGVVAGEWAFVVVEDEIGGRDFDVRREVEEPMHAALQKIAQWPIRADRAKRIAERMRETAQKALEGVDG